jgi:anti-sigma factor RsiW
MAGMSHDACDIGELMNAYLDGELRSGELEQVVEHLGECPDCILEFHELKETRATLRALPLLEAPEWLVPAAHFDTALSAYLDGELVPSEYQAVYQHVQVCTECREILHELDAARTAVRSLPGLDPPEFLEVARSRRSGRRFRRPSRVVAAVAGIAAAATLTVGILNSGNAPATSIDLGSFADRHAARASVEPGFQVIPAVNAGGTGP